MSTQSQAKGIDLGTTNSEIAELRGTTIHVFRNPDDQGAEYTPSAVYLNRANSLVVGREAKDRCESDPENAFMEFKRDMGSNAEYQFARNGKRMKPEELSAEVLKALCSHVQRATGEIVKAAVITVPADFDLPQCEATKKAALLAGIKHTVLLTEPVAAAQAYSFDSQDDKTFWLVYDFGGGTFDAAVIQVRDGLIQVTGHGGDNHLGGKNIDWAIVESRLIPALVLGPLPKVLAKPESVFSDANMRPLAEGDEELAKKLHAQSAWSVELLADCYRNEKLWSELTKRISLTDIKRGAAKWRGAIAKFKIQAEAAKIRLSSPTTNSTEMRIDFLCNDERGEPLEFEYELKRADLEDLAAPFIRKTVNICKEVLAARRLEPGNIGRMILVGGPTMMPFLRNMLQDQAEGLGIPLEFSVDPLTVVARGAAVFAASQRIVPDDEADSTVPAGQFAVKLDYALVGPDTDPEVAGTISAGQGVEKDFTGYTIEFVNQGIRPPWRSGKVGLGPKGNFLTNVAAEKGKANTFGIELRDPTGAIQTVSPNTFMITVKGVGVIGDPTMIHAVGVALANNEVSKYFDEGATLPSRKRKDFRTAISVKKGQSGQFIRVAVVEGKKSRADRNRVIGTLKIPAEKIARDVPAGSDIEVTIDIDKSRLIRTKAFIPILDEEFEDVLPLQSETPEAKTLVANLQKARERLKELRQKAELTGDAKAQAALQRIDGECMVTEAERLVGPANTEGDAARQCQNVLNRLNSSLDDVEEILEWPALVADAEKELTSARELVITDKYATADDKRIFEVLERETREAIEHHVPDLLRRRLDTLNALIGEVIRRDPGVWVHWFNEAKEERDKMQDSVQAEKLIAKGDRAINNGDVPGLKDAVRGLWRLLPVVDRPKGISDIL